MKVLPAPKCPWHSREMNSKEVACEKKKKKKSIPGHFHSVNNSISVHLLHI